MCHTYVPFSNLCADTFLTESASCRLPRQGVEEVLRFLVEDLPLDDNAVDLIAGDDALPAVGAEVPDAKALPPEVEELRDPETGIVGMDPHQFDVESPRTP